MNVEYTWECFSNWMTENHPEIKMPTQGSAVLLKHIFQSYPDIKKEMLLDIENHGIENIVWLNYHNYDNDDISMARFWAFHIGCELINQKGKL